jgi:ABC-type transporter Mla MlaB component
MEWVKASQLCSRLKLVATEISGRERYDSRAYRHLLYVIHKTNETYKTEIVLYPPDATQTLDELWNYNNILELLIELI